MEVRKLERWQKPCPAPDQLESEFYAAVARGELWYQRCPACGHAQFYPRGLCLECGATPEWATASGVGVVYTFTVVRQNHAKAFRDELPYAVAMVELPEGVKMLGGLTDCTVDEVRVGMEVEVHALEIAEGMGLPFWRPR